MFFLYSEELDLEFGFNSEAEREEKARELFKYDSGFGIFYFEKVNDSSVNFRSWTTE